MDSNDIIRSKEVKYKNKEILLEVALSLNKELFDENKISYKMFKYSIMPLERRRKIGFIYCSKAVKYGNATYKYKT